MPRKAKAAAKTTMRSVAARLTPARLASSTSSDIHASAVIERGAVIGEGAKIGPFCTVGSHVVIGDGVELKSHVAIAGRTSIGDRTVVFPFTSLGHQPQDLKYKGEPSTLSIGADCVIREGITMNPGTEGGGMKTVIGDKCVFLGDSHVGHDCIVGNSVILSHGAMLAGHVTLGDFVIVGGGAAIIQFARVGNHAFVGGLSGLEHDLIPYGMALGNRAHLSGLNIIGLQRRGFTREQIHSLRRAYRLLFAPEGTLKERAADVAEEFKGHPIVAEILEFLAQPSKRSLCMPSEQPKEVAGG